MSVASATGHIGWLLRVNRQLGPEHALHSGRAFAHAFRESGDRPLAPSQITRWENGEVRPSRGTIHRYERLLGLAPESLATVADVVMRSVGGGASIRDDHRQDPDQRRDRLFQLLDRVTTHGAMVGSDWTALTDLIAARPDLELYPPSLWDDMCARLLEELFTAVGGEWLQRQEAMSRLLEHRAAREHGVASCIAQVEDPSSPALIEPMTLLEVARNPAANRYVLRQIEHPHDRRTLEAALHTAARKVRLGQLRPVESARLAASIGALISDDALGDTLLPLAVEVGRGLAEQPAYAERLARRLPEAPVARRVWTSGRVIEPTTARTASVRIATLTRSRLAGRTGSADLVLAGLVEEGLFHSDPDRRFVATMLIAATPYRTPFAHVILDEIKTDLAQRRDGHALGAALRTLTVLGVDIHRPVIRDILTRPGLGAMIRHAAAWATPFCPGRYPESTWQQIFTTQLAAWRREPSAANESILQAVTYGIGTEGRRGLLGAIRAHPHAAPAARRMASAMLRTLP